MISCGLLCIPSAFDCVCTVSSHFHMNAKHYALFSITLLPEQKQWKPAKNELRFLPRWAWFNWMYLAHKKQELFLWCTQFWVLLISLRLDSNRSKTEPRLNMRGIMSSNVDTLLTIEATWISPQHKYLHTFHNFSHLKVCTVRVCGNAIINYSNLLVHL